MVTTFAEDFALPQNVTLEQANMAIDRWLQGPFGRSYKIKERQPNYLHVYMSHTPGWVYLTLCLGICIGIILILVSKQELRIKLTFHQGEYGLVAHAMVSGSTRDRLGEYSDLKYALMNAGGYGGSIGPDYTSGSGKPPSGPDLGEW